MRSYFEQVSHAVSEKDAAIQEIEPRENEFKTMIYNLENELRLRDLDLSEAMEAAEQVIQERRPRMRIFGAR